MLNTKRVFTALHPWLWWGFGVFIYLICLVPGYLFPDRWTQNIISADKWVHFWLYFFWTAILFLSRSKTLKPAIAFMLASGGIIEILQEWLIPGRYFDWYDWLADILGLCLAFILFYRRTRG